MELIVAYSHRMTDRNGSSFRLQGVNCLAAENENSCATLPLVQADYLALASVGRTIPRIGLASFIALWTKWFPSPLVEPIGNGEVCLK